MLSVRSAVPLRAPRRPTIGIDAKPTTSFDPMHRSPSVNDASASPPTDNLPAAERSTTLAPALTLAIPEVPVDGMQHSRVRRPDGRAQGRLERRAGGLDPSDDSATLTAPESAIWPHWQPPGITPSCAPTVNDRTDRVCRLHRGVAGPAPSGQIIRYHANGRFGRALRPSGFGGSEGSRPGSATSSRAVLERTVGQHAHTGRYRSARPSCHRRGSVGDQLTGVDHGKRPSALRACYIKRYDPSGRPTDRCSLSVEGSLVKG
jgi:hypothetical protein